MPIAQFVGVGFGTPKGALFAFGKANTGKSVLSDTLEFVLGGQTSSVNPQDMEKDFYIKNMRGKLANIVGEVNTNDIENTAVFKAVTSGKREKITANVKGKEMWEISFTLPHLFLGNDKPRGKRDFSDAFIIRQIAIPMIRKFEGADRDLGLDKKLEAEAAGIFNRGLRALQTMLAKDGVWDWKVPEAVRERQQEDAREQDQHTAWVEDRIVYEPPTADRDVFITKKQAFADYLEWGETQGYKVREGRNDKRNVIFLMAERTFGGKCKDLWWDDHRGSRTIEGKKVNGWVGVRFRTGSDPKPGGRDGRFDHRGPDGERTGQRTVSDAEEQIIRTAEEQGGKARKVPGGWVVEQDGREVVEDEFGETVELMSEEEQAVWEAQQVAEREARREYEGF